MRAVDDAVLAVLRAAMPDPALVHDGEVPVSYDDTNGAGTVVTSPVPYLVFYSDLGHEEGERGDGRPDVLPVGFQVTYVGLTRDQAKAAGQRARDALSGRSLTVAGHRSWLVRLEETQRVRPDNDARLPNGDQLFYGVDQYTLAVTRTS